MTPTQIDALSKLIAARMANKPPFEEVLWTAEEVAEYLKCQPRQVLERYALLRDFPAAIRLPTPDGHRGHPRWKAIEITAWKEKYKDRKKAA